MKLLTQAILNQFKRQDFTGNKDPKQIKIIAKFFNPCGASTWYATEYNPDERIFFGLVNLYGNVQEMELGYFSLDELEQYKHPRYGLGIERDMHFRNHMLSEVLIDHKDL